MMSERKSAAADHTDSIAVPVLAYPGACIVVTHESQGYSYTVESGNPSFSAQYDIAIHRDIAGKQLELVLGAIIPNRFTDVFRTNRMFPSNIIIDSMTIELELLKPSRNERVYITLLSGDNVPGAANVVTLLSTYNPVGPLYHFPVLAVNRHDGVDDVEPAVVPTRTSQCPDIVRALTYCNLKRNCTAVHLLQTRYPDTKPAATVLIPLNTMKNVPDEFLIGMSMPVLIMEYSRITDAAADTSAGHPDCVVVPLYRKMQGHTKDVYSPTLFGFWMLYWLDVLNERRKNVMPMGIEFYAPNIEHCAYTDQGESVSLSATSMTAPRSMLVHMYHTLLCQMCAEASARIYQTDKLNQALILGFKTGYGLDGTIATIRLSYRQIMLLDTNSSQCALPAVNDVAQLTGRGGAVRHCF